MTTATITVERPRVYVPVELDFGDEAFLVAEDLAAVVSKDLTPIQQAKNLHVRGGVQRLILEGFPSVAEVRLLGPNSGTANRYALGKARKAVQARVFVQVLRQGIRPVPPPVRVTLRYVMPDAIHRDADNFAVIAKPVIDGLVRGGILAGDNHARLTQRVAFVKERGRRALVVEIEEV